MARSLTSNQRKVLRGVSTLLRDSKGVNTTMGRYGYEATGTTQTLESLVRRGDVTKVGNKYRLATALEREATAAKSKTKVKTATGPQTTVPVATTGAPAKVSSKFLKSRMVVWVNPEDLVVGGGDPDDLFASGNKMYRSGEDTVTVRYDAAGINSFVTLRLGDTIEALRSLRDNPISSLVNE